MEILVNANLRFDWHSGDVDCKLVKEPFEHIVVPRGDSSRNFYDPRGIRASSNHHQVPELWGILALVGYYKAAEQELVSLVISIELSGLWCRQVNVHY